MENAGYKLVAAFVTLILGVVLLTVVASSTSSVGSFTAANNESHTLSSLCVANDGSGYFEINQTNSTCNLTVTNYPTGWQAGGGCPISSVSVYNSSGTLLTSGTDYQVFANTGIIRMMNTSATKIVNTAPNNNTLIYYQYCGPGYIDSSFGRAGVNLVPGFFAIALLLISVGLFYSVAKDYGIL